MNVAEILARPTALRRLTMSLVDFRRRGFRRGDPVVADVLEGHARAFLIGAELALTHGGELHDALATVPPERRGFAYEGAGMIAGVLDTVCRSRTGRLARLLDGPGDGYVHLAHVGFGWPPAPLRHLPTPVPSTPLLRWLALDGAGFADVFFGGPSATERLVRRATGPRAAIRLAGAGRALWFTHCADVEAITATISTTPIRPARELWAGVGLACAYAGGTGPDGLTFLELAAGDARPALRQGVMFAAAARVRSGHVPEHTRRAVHSLLGVEPEAVPSWTDLAAADLGTRRDVHAFELWRARLRVRGEHPAAPTRAGSAIPRVVASVRRPS